jgi:hypothetical protein
MRSPEANQRLSARALSLSLMIPDESPDEVDLTCCLAPYV